MTETTYLEKKRQEYREDIEKQVAAESIKLNAFAKDLRAWQDTVKAAWRNVRQHRKILAEKQAPQNAIIDGTWQPEPQREFEFQ